MSTVLSSACSQKPSNPQQKYFFQWRRKMATEKRCTLGYIKQGRNISTPQWVPLEAQIRLAILPFSKRCRAFRYFKNS